VPTRIRLRRMGKKKQPFYRIVVADSRTARDSKAIEEIGTYNPVSRPGTIQLKEDRVYDWLDKGAVPSDTVASLFRRIGVMHKWTLQKAGQDTAELSIKSVLVETVKPKGRGKKQAKATEALAKAAEPAPAKAEPVAAPVEKTSVEGPAAEVAAEATAVAEPEAAPAEEAPVEEPAAEVAAEATAVAEPETSEEDSKEA
jgi:small subunit ribosomal protein S16